MNIRCLILGHLWLDAQGLIDFLGDTYGVCPCFYCDKAKLVKAERE